MSLTSELLSQYMIINWCLNDDVVYYCYLFTDDVYSLKDLAFY